MKNSRTQLKLTRIDQDRIEGTGIVKRERIRQIVLAVIGLIYLGLPYPLLIVTGRREIIKM